jgi:3-hydroxybutyryl-CoA dehydrogenase
VEAEDIRRVLIVGSGIMGQEIGLQCAMHGFNVVLYDITPDILETSMSQIKEYVSQFIAEERLTREEAEATLTRLSTTTNPENAATGSDLISESVPEDPKLKRKIFAQFNELCPPQTIFTTNSSTLLPSMIAKATGRPSKFAALHFHQHVWESNVVDIMPHPGTSEETITLLSAFAKSIGQIPLCLKKENRGYVFNAMYSAWNQEALKLAANGIATVEEIDRACMVIANLPIGPFGAMDRVGLDTVWDISNYWAKRVFFLSQPRRIANFVKGYVENGHLGVKSGQGFYTYPNPAFEQPSFLEGE